VDPWADGGCAGVPRGALLTVISGSNCIRGGFVCAGYPPQRGTWPKPESKPAQVNIESKDPNYVPPGAYGMPQQPQPPPYGSQPLLGHTSKRDPIAYNRSQPSLRITPPQGRPLQSDDDRPTASTLMSASVGTPDHKLSALSYATSATANVFPTPVSAAPTTAFSDRTPKDYQRVPPLHDLTRTEPDHQQPSHPPPSQSTTLPQPPFNLHGGSRTNTPPSAAPPMTPMTSQPPSSGVQATAQLALSHTFPTDRPRREKEEMLNGRPFYSFDKELVLERERCNAACWRFNNSTNPNLGVSPAERARLFRDILHPREGVHITPTVMSPVTKSGHVGEHAAVEAPFNCDYGYNIYIGNNVSIGRNCLINDVCEVRVGNNVIISPNVCIYTGTCSTDPRRRAGNNGTQYGKPVIIEDDVWIAANVVILPGVRIGRGSTVGAGSVITRVCISCSGNCKRWLLTDTRTLRRTASTWAQKQAIKEALHMSEFAHGRFLRCSSCLGTQLFKIPRLLCTKTFFCERFLIYVGEVYLSYLAFSSYPFPFAVSQPQHACCYCLYFVS